MRKAQSMNPAHDSLLNIRSQEWAYPFALNDIDARDRWDKTLRDSIWNHLLPRLGDHCIHCRECRSYTHTSIRHVIPFVRIRSVFDNGPLCDLDGFIRIKYIPYPTSNPQLHGAHQWIHQLILGVSTCRKLLMHATDRHNFLHSGLGLPTGVSPTMQLLSRPMLNVLAKHCGIASGGKDIDIHVRLSVMLQTPDYDTVLRAVKHRDLQQFVKTRVPGMPLNRSSEQLLALIKKYLAVKSEKMSLSARLPPGVPEIVESYLWQSAV